MKKETILKREGLDRRNGPEKNTHSCCSTPRHPEGQAAEGGAIYTCPMHPEVRADRPGRCPHCGMFLVPLEGGAA